MELTDVLVEGQRILPVMQIVLMDTALSVSTAVPVALDPEAMFEAQIKGPRPDVAGQIAQSVKFTAATEHQLRMGRWIPAQMSSRFCRMFRPRFSPGTQHGSLPTFPHARQSTGIWFSDQWPVKAKAEGSRSRQTSENERAVRILVNPATGESSSVFLTKHDSLGT
jgi:hypothetical protein